MILDFFNLGGVGTRFLVFGEFFRFFDFSRTSVLDNLGDRLGGEFSIKVLLLLVLILIKEFEFRHEKIQI